ncbi:hypothetical protein ACFLSZ_04270 [Candidatus Bipolaricaulota bacterium]
MQSQLLPYCTWVRTESKLSNSTLAKAGSDLNAELEFVPVLQPDIDICFLFDGELCAAELKVFPRGRRSASFYEGIGQALALHRYGVERAALWLVFEDENQLRRLASCAWYFVREQTQLSLDFTPYLLRDGETDQPHLQIWRYESQHHAVFTGSMFDETPPHFRYRNPLLEDPDERNDALIVRRHVQEWIDRKLKTADRNPIDPIEVDPYDPGPTGSEHPQEAYEPLDNA